MSDRTAMTIKWCTTGFQGTSYSGQVHLSPVIKVLKLNQLRRDMWLNGYDVSLHRIYVGISKTAVSRATPNSQNTAGRFWMAATSSAEVRSSEVCSVVFFHWWWWLYSTNWGRQQRYSAAVLIITLLGGFYHTEFRVAYSSSKYRWEVVVEFRSNFFWVTFFRCTFWNHDWKWEMKW